MQLKDNRISHLETLLNTSNSSVGGNSAHGLSSADSAREDSINKLIDAYEQQVERVKEYKQRLISDAVTGKMNVTDEQTQTN